MRTGSIWTATCAAALFLLRPARCQDTGVPGAPDAAHYRYRIGHSVAVAGSNLYIEGGEVVSGQGNETEQSVICMFFFFFFFLTCWLAAKRGK